jgi:hypothetical protein
MDKTNIFWHLALHPLGSFSHVVAYRSSSKNKIKMKIQPILYKNLPWAHMELGFDVLGVAKKLVKYVVHLLKENLEKKNPFFIGCPNNKPIKFLCFFDKMMQFVTYNQTPFMSLPKMQVILTSLRNSQGLTKTQCYSDKEIRIVDEKLGKRSHS